MPKLKPDCVLEPVSGQPPRQLVLLLHGVGASGEDLMPLAEAWAPHLPEAAFVSPNAPFPYDGDFPDAYQWFSLADITEANREERVREAAPLLDAFIDEQLQAYGLPAERLILAGFSQGTIMSLYVALQRSEPVAGVLGYSGRLAGSDHIRRIIQSRPRTLLIHGTADYVIPVSEMHRAQTALQANDVPVAAVPMVGVPHSISAAGEALGLLFLEYCLSRPGDSDMEPFEERIRKGSWSRP